MSDTLERAAKLPKPVPGQVVVIPLDLWPVYMRLHGLEPMARGEVRESEQQNQSQKTDDVLWVKKSDGGNNG